MGEEPSFRYLPALDAIRAVAVGLVVVFHAFPAALPGGFIGVDIFFVLSGYLITSLLLREHERGGIDLRAFWGRRARRLLPAVWLLLGVTGAYALITGAGSLRWGLDQFGALTWSSNWVQIWILHAMPWIEQRNTLIDHLWSLGIEEQFYLVWPLVLGWVLAWRARAAPAVVALLCVASALSMGIVGYPSGYFRTDARAFELLFGALAAFVVPRLGPWCASFGLVGIGGVVWMASCARPTEAWMYPWGFLMVAVSSVFLVVAAALMPEALGRVIGGGLFGVIGRVSYGIYLWHVPVIRVVDARVGVEGSALFVLRMVVLAVVVGISYQFVEQPIRLRKFGLRPVSVLASATVLCVVAGVIVARNTSDADGRHDFPVERLSGRGTRVLVLGELAGPLLDRQSQWAPEAVIWAPNETCMWRPIADWLVRGEDPGCVAWETRWAHAIEDFNPDLVVISTSMAMTQPFGELDDLLVAQYRQLIEAQFAVAADRPTVMVVVSAPSGLDISPTPGRNARGARWAELAKAASAGCRSCQVIDLGHPENMEAMGDLAAARLSPQLR